MIMGVMKLISCIFGLLVLLVRIANLQRTILVDCMLMVPVFDTVLELDILRILSVQEHVLRKDIDDCENIQDLQHVGE